MSSYVPSPQQLEAAIATPRASRFANPFRAHAPKPAPLDPKLLAQLQQALKRFAETPKKRSNLLVLLHISQTIRDVFQRLLLTLMPTDPRRETLKEFADAAVLSYQFYLGISKLASADGRAMLQGYLRNRIAQQNGKVLCRMSDERHLFEALDPLHRCLGHLEYGLAKTIEKLQGADPVDSIIDYVLSAGAQLVEENSMRAMDGDQMSSHIVTLTNGKLYAYYAHRANGGVERYNPKGMNLDAILSVHRALFTTAGSAGNTPRGGMDLLEGDPYVLSPANELYSFNQRGQTFHSEFLSGAPIQAGGILVAKDGVVQAIDNCSGHYMPTSKQLAQAVQLLVAWGVLDAEAFVGLMSPVGGVMYFSVPDFLQLARQDFSYTGMREMLRRMYARYNGALPVPPSKLKYIPPAANRNWTAAEDSNWNQFLKAFYPALYKPLAVTGRESAVIGGYRPVAPTSSSATAFDSRP